MKAILNEQLEGVLQDLGVLESINAHTIKCPCCGKIIELSNIGVLIPHYYDNSTVVDIYCGDYECIKSILK